MDSLPEVKKELKKIDQEEKDFFKNLKEEETKKKA